MERVRPVLEAGATHDDSAATVLLREECRLKLASRAFKGSQENYLRDKQKVRDVQVTGEIQDGWLIYTLRLDLDESFASDLLKKAEAAIIGVIEREYQNEEVAARLEAERIRFTFLRRWE
jgi:hypothetical protein